MRTIKLLETRIVFSGELPAHDGILRLKLSH